MVLKTVVVLEGAVMVNPPALSEYGKELVVVSDLLTAAFPKKDSCTCC